MRGTASFSHLEGAAFQWGEDKGVVSLSWYQQYHPSITHPSPHSQALALEAAGAVS